MPATFTASGYSPTPRAAHTGVQVFRSSRQLATGSLSTSDVIYFGTLPGVCTVLNGYVKAAVADGSFTFKLGTSASDANILAGTSFSGAATALSRLILVPVELSISDDATPYNNQVIGTLVAKGTSYSGTVSISVVIEYAVPGAV